ncbi:MAG TPA: fused MFS/spermidine synthase [Streptosporangiaceae bacterium]|nr:fused MFS/spermidine synthase [Streptosporangiaceae bacterium]
MATQPREGSEPAADQQGTDGRVELLADLDRPGSWTLLVDGISQSHVDLGDPRHLDLEYMQRLGHLTDLAAPAGTPLRVLHLGAGGLTLARYVAATRPGSRQLAVEADEEVAALVRQRLPLGRAQPGTGRIGVRLGDARAVLERLSAGSFDVVVADVFAGDRTPAHLTSMEFTRAAARVLAPTGAYAVNVGDGPPLAHARARVATVRAVFPHVCVMAEPAVLRGRRFGNLVVVGSCEELPLTGLARRLAADPFPARLVAGAELDQFIAGAAPIVDASAEPSPPMPPEVFA